MPIINHNIDFIKFKFENEIIDRKNHSKPFCMFLNNSYTQDEFSLSLSLREGTPKLETLYYQREGLSNSFGFKPKIKSILKTLFNKVRTWDDLHKLCSHIKESGNIDFNSYQQSCLKNPKYLHFLIGFDEQNNPYLRFSYNISLQVTKIINTNIEHTKQSTIDTHNSIIQANYTKGGQPKRRQRSMSPPQKKLNQKSQRICDYFKSSSNMILY